MTHRPHWLRYTIAVWLAGDSVILPCSGCLARALRRRELPGAPGNKRSHRPSSTPSVALASRPGSPGRPALGRQGRLRGDNRQSVIRPVLHKGRGRLRGQWAESEVSTAGDRQRDRGASKDQQSFRQASMKVPLHPSPHRSDHLLQANTQSLALQAAAPPVIHSRHRLCNLHLWCLSDPGRSHLTPPSRSRHVARQVRLGPSHSAFWPFSSSQTSMLTQLRGPMPALNSDGSSTPASHRISIFPEPYSSRLSHQPQTRLTNDAQ